MFDFRLKVFHTVAKRLSFTKAAADLFITQPAVTKHIQELEQRFKVQLFERQGNQIKLRQSNQTHATGTGDAAICRAASEHLPENGIRPQ
jgi:LysR family transcriptional regulator, transcriptional activator of the cysJI operon